jgi:hypothetical protein
MKRGHPEAARCRDERPPQAGVHAQHADQGPAKTPRATVKGEQGESEPGPQTAGRGFSPESAPAAGTLMRGLAPADRATDGRIIGGRR